MRFSRAHLLNAFLDENANGSPRLYDRVVADSLKCNVVSIHVLTLVLSLLSLLALDSLPRTLF
jgi:hypothetical protein